jgi:hypothetical protein
MSDTIAITDAAIRENLLKRAKAYAAKSGCSLSFISKQAVGDDKFLRNAERGSNFTINTYQRVIDWIDAAEAAIAQPPAGAEREGALA